MEPNPRMELFRLINGFQITQAIRVAAVLRVADHLREGPRPVAEVAALTKSHPDALYRLLRALAAVGIFEESENQHFALTPMGDCLRSDSTNPIGAWAEHVGSPYYWQTWGHLLHTVQTGGNAFQALNGKDIWQYRIDRPEEAETFNRAMTQLSRGTAEAMLGSYDFSGFRHVVDVGGGHGYLLASVLKAHANMRGTLFDQPGVVAGAKAILTERGVADRVDIVGGNFFEKVPAGADAYLLRAVIHDWGDDEAIAILKACRQAMQKAAKLLLVEQIIAPPNKIPASKFGDLNMLVMLGGRERTREEFSDLFAKSGFALSGVAPAGVMNVIEAIPR